MSQGNAPTAKHILRSAVQIMSTKGCSIITNKLKLVENCKPQIFVFYNQVTCVKFVRKNYWNYLHIFLLYASRNYFLQNWYRIIFFHLIRWSSGTLMPNTFTIMGKNNTPHIPYRLFYPTLNTIQYLMHRINVTMT